jgi:hypothetical protein
MPETFHTIIGMPSSGKTTFLAALWHLLTAGELDSKLELETLKGDVTYLNGIVEMWRKCKQVRRTSIAEESDIVMYLKDRTGQRSFVLSFRDLSGEAFKSQFATRTCSAEFVEHLNGDGTVLLFVTADRPHQAVSILDAGVDLIGNVGNASVETAWTHESVSEQAKLVDLLSGMQQDPFQRKLRKLALVISAWDVVEAENPARTPEQWLQEELPFLWQFLTSNPQSFRVQVYGVSAQGGDISETAGNTDTRTALLEKVPSERIVVKHGSEITNDLSQPILWLSE